MQSIALLGLLANGWTQTQMGSWKMNLAPSKYSGIRPKSVIVRLEPHRKGEVVTVDRTESNGQSTSSNTIVYPDGAIRQFEQGCSGPRGSRRPDAQTVETVRQCDNGDWERVVRRIAPSGRELVVEITRRRSGRVSEDRLVLEKQ